jgi:D-alanyl-D-alanine carboxypeptidase
MKSSKHAPLIRLIVLGGTMLLAAACAGNTPENAAQPEQPTVAAPSPEQKQNQSDNPDPDSKQTDDRSGAEKAPRTDDPESGKNSGKDTAANGGNGNSGSVGKGKGASNSKTGQNKSSQDKDVQVVAKPDDIAVLVNKTYALPDNYKPNDLVEPDIPFIFKEKSEKRLMRKEAAQALEKLVEGAKKDGVYLAGVSGYRSQATQKSLFERYVKQDGEEKARMYSAVPGHSEHQTGLAMDISGTDGKCAASDCFAGTKEAEWLAKNAHEYGFIIRYPKGKEDITGYQYEPWHLRYVGTDIAQEIAKKDLTLEEYMETKNATPAADQKK